LEVEVLLDLLQLVVTLETLEEQVANPKCQLVRIRHLQLLVAAAVVAAEPKVVRVAQVEIQQLQAEPRQLAHLRLVQHCVQVTQRPDVLQQVAVQVVLEMQVS
jgi:hypothetical protein